MHIELRILNITVRIVSIVNAALDVTLAVDDAIVTDVSFVNAVIGVKLAVPHIINAATDGKHRMTCFKLPIKDKER